VYAQTNNSPSRDELEKYTEKLLQSDDNIWGAINNRMEKYYLAMVEIDKNDIYIKTPSFSLGRLPSQGTPVFEALRLSTPGYRIIFIFTNDQSLLSGEIRDNQKIYILSNDGKMEIINTIIEYTTNRDIFFGDIIREPDF
jgi:hypothetical protein